jgi:hypothetical protein
MITFTLPSVSICLYRDAGNLMAEEDGGGIEEPAKEQGRQQVKQYNNVLPGPVYATETNSTKKNNNIANLARYKSPDTCTGCCVRIVMVA